MIPIPGPKGSPGFAKLAAFTQPSLSATVTVAYRGLPPPVGANVVAVLAGAAAAALTHVGSGTTLAERLLGWNTYADEDDIGLDIVDVYTAFLDGAERPGGWPTVEDDKAAIDALIAARAPV